MFRRTLVPTVDEFAATIGQDAALDAVAPTPFDIDEINAELSGLGTVPRELG